MAGAVWFVPGASHETLLFVSKAKVMTVNTTPIPTRRRRTTAAVSALALAVTLVGGIPSAGAFAHGQPPVAATTSESRAMLQPDPTSPTVYEFGETLAGLEG